MALQVTFDLINLFSKKWVHFMFNEMMFLEMLCMVMGGVVASWLVRSSLDPVVQVRALAGDIVLCS